jgi:hypothetical protein
VILGFLGKCVDFLGGNLLQSWHIFSNMIRFLIVQNASKKKYDSWKGCPCGGDIPKKKMFRLKTPPGIIRREKGSEMSGRDFIVVKISRK